MVGRTSLNTLSVQTTRLEEEKNKNKNSNTGSNNTNGEYAATPRTAASTPSSSPSPGPNHGLTNPNATSTLRTPRGMRGTSDIRSPGVNKTPLVDTDAQQQQQQQQQQQEQEQSRNSNPYPDLMTQTDQYGNATTPRTAPVTPTPNKSVQQRQHPLIPETPTDETEPETEPDDACESLLDSFRMMCCCILPNQDVQTKNGAVGGGIHRNAVSGAVSANKRTGGLPSSSTYSPAVHPTRQIVKEDVDVNHGNHQIKLLPPLHSDDHGKKCLVLDLDETLVHSSFRAVPGADFVIPVQIDDVVHFVYVIKRPGVDEFLIEMAKHFEIVIYTASLNKYADPLLDLLDPQNTIRFRLFRESCVYYEGSYVKDLSLLNRDLTQTIIVDNSPASYIFHPESAIDCSSFIDDPADRELRQIGAFLTGVRNVKDVRGICETWREWPRLPASVNADFIEFPKGFSSHRNKSRSISSSSSRSSTVKEEARYELTPGPLEV